MRGRQQNMSNKIRKKFDDLSYSFDERSWEKMENLLDTEYKPTVTVWKRYVAVAAAVMLLLATAVTYYVLNSEPDNEGRLTRNLTFNENNGLCYSSENACIPAETSVYGNKQYNEKPKAASQSANALIIDYAITNQGETSQKKITRPQSSQKTRSKTNGQNLSTLRASQEHGLSSGNSDDMGAGIEEDKELLKLVTAIRYIPRSPQAPLIDNSKVSPVEVDSVDEKKSDKKERIDKKRRVKRYYEESNKFNPIPSQWGIKAGFNSAIVGVSDPFSEGPDQKIQTGPVAGLYFTYPLPGILTLQVEADWRRIKNYSIRKDHTIGSQGRVMSVASRMTELEMITISMVPQLRISSKAKVELGGSFSGIDPKYVLYMPANAYVSDGPDPEGGIEEWTCHAIIGFEMRLSSRFKLNARYNIGLRDISRDYWYENSENHRASDVSVILKFRLNKNNKESR